VYIYYNMAHVVKGFHSTGGFSRLNYDRCAYQKKVFESVGPLAHQMYPGYYENCSKCTHDDYFPRPFDGQIIDAESELTNRTRRATRCPQYKYLPGCPKSCYCTNTFDKDNKIVLPQEVCPIVHSNIGKMQSPGYNLQTEPFCEQRIPRHPVPRNVPQKRVVMVRKQ
jgi:hypothetical protein